MVGSPLGEEIRQSWRPAPASGNDEDLGAWPKVLVSCPEVPAALSRLVLRPDLDSRDAYPGLVEGLGGHDQRTRTVGRPTRNRGAPSDAAPPGKQPAAWQEPPSDWRSTARDAIPRMDQRSLAWVGADGYPLSVPVTGLDQTESGFRLQIGRHLPGTPAGPACLTVHTHPEEFTGQENHTFLGEVRGSSSGEYDFVVERALADWSITGNKIVRTIGFLRRGRQLKPRLAAEAARRGQPVPIVRLP